MSRFTRSFRAELAKLFTGRLWWALGLVLVGYVAMIAGFLALTLTSPLAELLGAGAELVPQREVVALVYSTSTSIGYVIPILLGALLITAEYRHGTLAATFSAEPRRALVLAAKSLVALLAGLGLGVLGALGAVGAGAAVIAANGVDPMLGDAEIWGLIGATVLALGLWSLIGLGLGVLVRNQAIAVTIALAFTQFVEPVLRIAAMQWSAAAQVAAYLPGSATDAFVGTGLFSSMGAFDPSMGGAEPVVLPGWLGLLVLLGYAAVLVLLGGLLRWRRDLD